ncbi:FecR family protein [Brevundimonas lutea]|uniref:FecR family protein n=1 Tax=Brevundimonas lutea TaxID=2293980 RepID=UPI000F034027|nr:FecR domain-containing protein [Brevundimonas lutea]
MTEGRRSSTSADASLQAAEWHARLAAAQVDADEIRAFGDWLENAENARAWSEIQSVWDAAGGLSEDAGIQALTRQALFRPRGKRPELRWVSGGAALAATVLVTVAAAGWWTRGETYASPPDGLRRLTLEDGSTLVLDADSEARVRLRDTGRTIELREGRAYFDVAFDAARPFSVRAGEVTVTALGTRFDVDLGPDGVAVNLYEGRVILTGAGGTLSLQPGDAAVATSEGLRRATEPAEADGGWIDGRMVFRDALLRDVVAEMNRYFDRPVRLSPELERTRVSGVFSAGDRAGFVSALTAMLPAQARTDDTGATLLTPAP